MERRNKHRLRLFAKQGYIMLLVGILIGFMVFLAVSAITAPLEMPSEMTGSGRMALVNISPMANAKER